MDILHVIPGVDYVNGGTAMALRALLQGQAAEDMRPSVTAAFGRDSTENILADLPAQDIPVHLVGPTRGALKFHPQLADHLDSAVRGASVVHIHGVWESIQFMASRACQLHGTPYVVAPHGMLSPWSLAQRRLKKQVYIRWRLRRLLDEAAVIHYTSDAEARDAAPIAPLTPAVTIPNAIDLQEFRDVPPPGFLRQRLGLDPSERIVLFLGRLHRKKGLDLLAQAFADCDHDHSALVIAGPDEGMRDVLTALVSSRGIEHRVHFTGVLDRHERIAALGDAHVLALPSYDENFGVVVVEALATGTPVIMSDRVALHDLAEPAFASVVPCRVEALAKALSAWLNTDTSSDQVVTRARAVAFDNFDCHTIARRWYQQYLSLQPPRPVQLTTTP